jgi:hypothetical protein
MSCGPVGGASRTQNTSCSDDGNGSPVAAHESHDLLPGPLNELATSSDVGAQLAGLIVKAAYDQKEGARETRKISERAQREAEDKQLTAMKDDADSSMVAGLMEGGTQIAGGAMGVVGANAAPATQAALKGSAAVVEGMGKIDSAFAKHDASMSKQQATAQEQNAAREKRAVDDARDLDKDAKELLNRALGYYKEYLTAKADTQRATLLKA